MNKPITFVFDSHPIKIASDAAAALLDSALFVLECDARLLPNERERDLLHGWRTPETVEAAWTKGKLVKPVVTVEQKVSEVYGELFNCAVDKYKRGGYPCYSAQEKRWRWALDPWLIAKEMNTSHLFSFHVSPVHVERAQAMLK